MRYTKEEGTHESDYGRNLDIQEIFKKENQSFAFTLGKIVRKNPQTNEQELLAKLKKEGYSIGGEGLRKALNDLGLEKAIVKAS